VGGLVERGQPLVAEARVLRREQRTKEGATTVSVRRKRGVAFQMLRGEAAWDRMRDPAFQTEWEELRAACPWATVFQSVRFVLAWQRCYEGAVEPLLVVGRAGGARLVGMLHLGVSVADGKVVVCGNQHCEYKVWLARPEENDGFLDAAFSALRASSPEVACDWTLCLPVPRWSGGRRIPAGDGSPACALSKGICWFFPASNWNSRRPTGSSGGREEARTAGPAGVRALDRSRADARRNGTGGSLVRLPARGAVQCPAVP